VEWQLDALGLQLEEFDGRVLDLLDVERVSHVGRVLKSEAGIARRVLRGAQLSQMEAELHFTRAQFDSISRASSEHKIRNVAARLWRLQRRIDELEAKIAQLRGGHGEPHRLEGPGADSLRAGKWSHPTVTRTAGPGTRWSSK
jgi:hypothetical protein